jgi:putative hydrolase of the HAD superfamily
MIKALIFDVDGVIVNTGFFSEKLAKDYGTPLDITLPFFKGRFQDCQIGKADLKEELENIKSDWGWVDSTNKLLDYWFEDSKNIDQNLINDINNYKRRGIKCFLGTNQEKYRIEYLRDEVGLRKIFDGIFVSAEIGFRKPAKKFFEYISSKLIDIDASEVLFWDSDQEVVDAVREYGFNSELYTTHKDFKVKMNGYLDQ